MNRKFKRTALFIRLPVAHCSFSNTTPPSANRSTIATTCQSPAKPSPPAPSIAAASCQSPTKPRLPAVSTAAMSCQSLTKLLPPSNFDCKHPAECARHLGRIQWEEALANFSPREGREKPGRNQHG